MVPPRIPSPRSTRPPPAPPFPSSSPVLSAASLPSSSSQPLSSSTTTTSPSSNPSSTTIVLPLSPDPPSPPHPSSHPSPHPTDTATTNTTSTPDAPSSWRLRLLLANNLGVLIGYASQSTLGTSELLRHGVAPSHLSLVFLAGPISGLFVQPIVGLVSDRIRQRRPFILLGAISVALSLLAMACARGKRDAIVAFCMLDVALNAIQAPIRAMISDALPVPTRRNATALLTAFGAAGSLVSGGLAARKWDGLRMWMGFEVDAQVVLTLSAGIALASILPCAFLAPETPVRGGDGEEDEVEREVVDRESGQGKRRLKKERSGDYDVNNEQHHLHDRDVENNDDGHDHGNDGDVKDDDDDDDEDDDITDNPTVTFLPHPRDRTTSDTPSAVRKQRMRRHLHLSRNRPPARLIWPRPFWQTFIVQLCTWSGFFALSVYGNAWIGTSVFGGDGSAPVSSPPRLKFDAGVRLGSFAQALSAVIMFLVSTFVLPYVTSVAPVYALSQVVEVLSLCTPLVLTAAGGAYGRKIEAVAALAMFGVVSAVTNTVPWLVLAQALHVDSRTKGKVGLYTTVFNVSQALPQLVLGVVAPVVMTLVGNRPPVVMALAGGLALLGLVLIFALRVDTLEDGRTIVLGGAGVERRQDVTAVTLGGDAARVKTKKNKKTNGGRLTGGSAEMGT